jgi:hypothetical protein
MDQKKKNPNKRVVIPKSHPPAWGSALWEHVDTIRSMRRARKKWREIAAHLTENGVPISAPSVRNFFARATDPEKRRPLGFVAVPLTEPAGHLAQTAENPMPAPQPQEKPLKERFAQHTLGQIKAEAEKSKQEKPLEIYQDDK